MDIFLILKPTKTKVLFAFLSLLFNPLGMVGPLYLSLASVWALLAIPIISYLAGCIIGILYVFNKKLAKRIIIVWFILSGIVTIYVFFKIIPEKLDISNIVLPEYSTILLLPFFYGWGLTTLAMIFYFIPVEVMEIVSNFASKSLIWKIFITTSAALFLVGGFYSTIVLSPLSVPLLIVGVALILGIFKNVNWFSLILGIVVVLLFAIILFYLFWTGLIYEIF